MIRETNIPASLKALNSWVVWRTISRNGAAPTKVPFGVNGKPASSTDPTTWSTFTAAMRAYDFGGKYTGVGFVFSKDDPFCGIDLDGCRNPETGEVASWAREIITTLATYAEVSPSETGVKLFAVGKLPFGSGRKVELTDVPRLCDKQAAIEVYDHGRYFAVTGLRLQGMPCEPEVRQDPIDELCRRYWPDHADAPDQQWHAPASVFERARKYIATLPPAVSGQSGHQSTFHAACVLCLGFGLDREQALTLLHEYNQSCQPPWNDRELNHKIDSAMKQPGPRNYLRLAKSDNWGNIAVPKYVAPPAKSIPRLGTLVDGANEYIARIRDGKTGLIDTGLADLDYALGGGVEPGELIILAARPSHGKSAVALQCAHNWTDAMMPVLFVSEEMSRLALGKRTLQYASELPQEHWSTNADRLEDDLKEFHRLRSQCFVVEGCGTTDAVIEQIERAVEEYAVKAVIVDYVQLLSSPGRARYEQITNTSIALRRVASEQKIVLLALCQLSRVIESRKQFIPIMSDIKESGQLEQDADVIVFLVWPHRLDASEAPNKFKFYVAKNRNRAINQGVVECRFNPVHQRIEEQRVEDMPNYHAEFEDERVEKSY